MNSHFLKLTFLFCLISIGLFAQNEGSLDQLYLQGKWSATCPIEVVNRVSIQNCMLCQFEKDPNNSKSIGSSTIELNFKGDSLEIIRGKNSAIVAMTRNIDNHSFQFDFEGEKYSFRMFLYGSDKRIIENSDGTLVVMEKIEEVKK